MHMLAKHCVHTPQHLSLSLYRTIIHVVCCYVDTPHTLLPLLKCDASTHSCKFPVKILYIFFPVNLPVPPPASRSHFKAHQSEGIHDTASIKANPTSSVNSQLAATK